MRHYNSQMADKMSGGSLSMAGGQVIVCAAGTQKKLAITDINGNALANPLPLVAGKFDFYVADTVPLVDVYVYTPTGHCRVSRNLAISPNELHYDARDGFSEWLIPFNATDQVSGNLTDTGIVLPAGVVVTGNPVVDVRTAEATRTISFGTTGAATAFVPATTVAAIGDVAAASVAVANNTAIDLAYTLSAGTTVAAGFIRLPVSVNL